MNILTVNEIKNFMSKIVQSRNCWIWTGGTTNKGYGTFWLNARMNLSHRISYELFKEDIPTGLVIDHLCKNPSCVNPDHMEIVTQKENALRGIGIPAINARKTHCPQGHEYTKENTQVYENRRKCGKCIKINNQKYYYRNKASHSFSNGMGIEN